MSIHEERIELFKKYYDKIQKQPYPVYVGEDIPSKLLSNAIRKYATDIDTKKVIAMCDSSLLGNGKSGFIFADRRFVFTEVLGKSHTIYYSKIVDISLTDKGNDISIHLTDGSIIKTYNSCMDMYALKEFLEDIIKFNEDNPDCPDTQIEKHHFNSTEELSILQKSEVDLSLKNDKIMETENDLECEPEMFLLSFKLAYLAEKNNLNDNSLIEIYEEIVNIIMSIYKDVSIREHLINEIDKVIQDETYSFDNIKVELEELSLQDVEDLLEGIKTEYENKEGDNETVKLLSEYIDSRKGESQKQGNHCIEEDIVTEQKQSFSEKHPIITGFGKFAKNAGLSFIGTCLNMSDKEIEKLKSDDIFGVLTDLKSGAESQVAIMQSQHDRTEAKRERYKKALEEEYKKGFSERGLDYDILKGNKKYYNKEYYLKSKNISNSDFQKILVQVRAEVKSAMQQRGYDE